MHSSVPTPPMTPQPRRREVEEAEVHVFEVADLDAEPGPDGPLAAGALNMSQAAAQRSHDRASRVTEWPQTEWQERLRALEPEGEGDRRRRESNHNPRGNTRSQRRRSSHHPETSRRRRESSGGHPGGRCQESNRRSHHREQTRRESSHRARDHQHGGRREHTRREGSRREHTRQAGNRHREADRSRHQQGARSHQREHTRYREGNRREKRARSHDGERSRQQPNFAGSRFWDAATARERAKATYLSFKALHEAGRATNQVCAVPPWACDRCRRQGVELECRGCLRNWDTWIRAEMRRSEEEKRKKKKKKKKKSRGVLGRMLGNLCCLF
ncbi:hypothetical protein VTK26DRAFT_4658 [Humicola hyalothermophila]